MIIAVPNATPVTCPVLSTVATNVLPLVQETAVAVVSLNMVTDPAHTVNTPKIAEGFFITVFGYVIKQPVANVYVTVAVPWVTPAANIPVVPMLASPVTVHAPPAVASLNVMFVPAHSDVAPCTGIGLALMVNILVTTQLAVV